jgi:hypothetical protein
MLDLETQSRLADAAASILRAQLRAASHALTAAATRSWSLWTLVQVAGPGATVNWPMPAPGLWARWSWAQWPSLVCGAPHMGAAALAPIWWTGADPRFWFALAAWRLWSGEWLQAHQGKHPSTPVPRPTGPAGPCPAANFARYRSASGHAVAQVTVPAIDDLAQVAAKPTLSPGETMLGVWRAALGV